MNELTLTSEERILAGLSHLSGLVPGYGIILPGAFWASYRRKSEYIRFQSLQALSFQISLYLFWMIFAQVLLIGMLVLMAIFGAAFSGSSGEEIGVFMAIFWGVFLFLFFGAGLVYLILVIVAAVSGFMGRDFRYPLLAAWLERYLNRPEAGV